MQSRPRVSRNRDITRLSRHCVIMAWDARRRRSVRICGLRLVRPGRPRLDRKFGISRVHACPRVLSRLARGGIARLLRRFQFRPVPAVADQHCQDTHAHDRDCERDCRERCSVDAMPITHIHDPITSRDKPASRLRFRTWPNPGRGSRRRLGNSQAQIRGILAPVIDAAFSCDDCSRAAVHLSQRFRSAPNAK